MSTQTSPGGDQVREQHQSFDPGYGWVLFSALLLFLLATINLVEGLSAIGGSHFYVRNPHLIAGSLNTWGWVVTVIGTLQYVAGFGVLVKQQLARWLGVGLLGLDVIVQLLMLPEDPFFSLVVLALDVLAIYALVVHGEMASRSR